MTFSYLIVAKPKAELRETWITLLTRLAIAFLVGLVIVGALALYLSRRITKPVLALSKAMDQVAQGRVTWTSPRFAAAARSPISPSVSAR